MTSSVRLAVGLACALLPATAGAATRGFYEDFDHPDTLDQELWFGVNDCGKKIVGSADGADVHAGNCLRGNWAAGITDPITDNTSTNDVSARYAGFDIVVSSWVQDEMFIDYWAYVDPGAAKAFGAKWMWLQGTYQPNPNVYNTWFNHLLLPPWEGWDTWQISSNNDQIGEIGGNGDRVAHLSQIPGLVALMNGQGVEEWFPGRWHHFQVYVRLNSPASDANGIFQFWLDGVTVLDLADYRYRDSDDDHISHFATPHMYGGSEPPPGSFGWQLDELAVWDGMPDETDAGTAGTGGTSGGGSGGSGNASSTDAGAGSGGTSAGGTSSGGASTGGATSNASDSGDDGGCSIGARHVDRDNWLGFGLLLMASGIAMRRGAARRGRSSLKLRLALLVSTVSFAAHAVPNVTSVTGTVADDQVVVISGSLFGENALEQEWLGGASGFIDSLPNGARFDEQNRPGWTLLEPSTPTYPHISTELAWSRGKSIAFDVRGTEEYKQSLFYDTGNAGYSELYTNALIRVDHDDLLSGSHLQWKMMRWTHTETVVDGDGSILSNWPGSMSYYSTYSDSGQTTFWFDSPGAESLPGRGAWYRYECWVRPGESYFRVRVTNPTTGEVVADNERTDMPHDASTPHRYWVLQNFFGNASDGGYSQADNGNAVAFWDDVYASKSQARVEVCESSTWSGCANRELQPASAWANGSISVRLNQGALGTLSHAFLYVTDANGAVNEQGFELGTGPTSDSGAPTGGAAGTAGTGGAIGADAGNADAGAGTSSGGASSNGSDSGDDGGCSIGRKLEHDARLGSFGLVVLAFAYGVRRALTRRRRDLRRK